MPLNSMKNVRLVSVVAGLFALAGCEALPRTGPDDKIIAMNASATLAEREMPEASIQYAAVDVTSHVLPFLTVDSPSSGLSTLGFGAGAPPELFVGVGDVVQVTVFESQGGGLFVPDDEGSARTGNFVTLPLQNVDRQGLITVPYAGQVRALGRSLTDIEADIVTRITDLAIEPQVTLSLVARNSANVTVAGAVEEPGRFEVTEVGDRVLDVLARAGGLDSNSFESTVTLTRGAQSATISHARLLGNPRENIFVQPGDTITVNTEQRRFLSFGATGSTAEFIFDREQLDLNEAVARVGGLLDDRADPGQVLIYRHEGRRALEHMGADLSAFPPHVHSIPTIYRMNFRRPDAYFLASKFGMRDSDILYVSNADSVELFKFLNLITGITGAVNTATGNVDGTINVFPLGN